MFVAALRDGDVRVRLTAAYYLPILLSVSLITRHEHVYGSLKSALLQSHSKWQDGDSFQLCMGDHTTVAGRLTLLLTLIPTLTLSLSLFLS